MGSTSIVEKKVLYFSFPILALQLCYSDYLQEGVVEPLYFTITLRPTRDAFLVVDCQASTQGILEILVKQTVGHYHFLGIQANHEGETCSLNI